MGHSPRRLCLRRPPPADQASGFRLTPSHAVYAEALLRDFDGLRAVDEVKLRIPAGEINLFLDPSGADKSTTARMLCTLMKPTRGRALAAGYNVAT